MKRTVTLILIGLFVCMMACNKETDDSEAGTAADKINPNGSSELALLMRHMFDAAMYSKNQIIKGNDAEMTVEYEKILTAKPTDSSMIDYPEFKPLAKSYISAMERLDTVSKDNAPQAHMAVVSTCKSCHTISCPGPMERIEKLELPKVLLGKD